MYGLLYGQAAAAKRTGDKGELNSFWQENKGRSAGNKSHNNSHNRYRSVDIQVISRQSVISRHLGYSRVFRLSVDIQVISR